MSHPIVGQAYVIVKPDLSQLREMLLDIVAVIDKYDNGDETVSD
nr:hypothetical protein [Bifidobacterium catenulatum]